MSTSFRLSRKNQKVAKVNRMCCLSSIYIKSWVNIQIYHSMSGNLDLLLALEESCVARPLPGHRGGEEVVLVQDSHSTRIFYNLYVLEMFVHSTCTALGKGLGLFPYSNRTCRTEGVWFWAIKTKFTWLHMRIHCLRRYLLRTMNICCLCWFSSSFVSLEVR